MKKQTEQKPAKSATVTLRSNGSTLMLMANLKADGTAMTFAVTKDADKKASRGLTESHASMDEAKSHLASLAEKAEKLGWKRGARIVAPKPDAFSKLPAAPKVTA